MNKIFRNTLLLLGTAAIGYEVKTVYIDRPKRRRLFFDLASKKATETKKPLLVIGDPYADNYAFSVDYGCGDLCIDINDCLKCSNSSKHDINEGFPTFKDNSYVVFISCTLEYVDNIESVYKELVRISGGNLFVVALEAYSLKTLFARNLGYSKFNRKWRILKSPPSNNTFLAEKF